MRPGTLGSALGCALILAGVVTSGLPLAAAPAGAAAPPDTLRLTLEAAVERALARGEEMQAARAQVAQAKGRVREEVSRALPHLTGSLTYTRKIESIFAGVTEDTTFGPLFKQSAFAAPNTWIADLTASQLLYSGGKVGAALSAARQVRRAMAAQESETRNEVVFLVKQAYFDAALAARMRDIAEAGLGQARDLAREVELQYREGARAEYDLIRAQVDAANQEPPAVSARNQYEIALLELRRLVNVAPEEPLVLATPLAFADSLVPVVTEAELPGIGARPALEAAEAMAEARAQAVRVEKGGRWPDLTLSSSYQQQAFPSNAFPSRRDFRRNWEATLQLNVPIFLGLQTQGAIGRARAELAQARVERDQLREAVALEAARSRAELERARALLVARRETVRQASRAHHIAGVRFSAGLATQLEVSDARLQLRTAETNEVLAVRDYLVALAGVERALGQPAPVTYRPLDEVTSIGNAEGTKP